MIEQLSSTGSRILFVGSFALAGLAGAEKLANVFGFTLTIVRGYTPSRLLELVVVALLFVIALQLRDIKHHPATGRG